MDRTLSELRFGLAPHDPSVIDFALQLQQALDSTLGLDRQPLSGRRGISDRHAEQLADDLERAFERGLLVVELNDEPVVERTDLRPLKLPDLPAPPRPPAVAGDTFYDVRFVDEIGQAVIGIQIAFDLGDDNPSVNTNAAGVALLQGVKATSGVVSIPDVESLEKALLPRWSKRRSAERNYQISGPVALSGQTDDGGVLMHPDVPFGDYQLTLQLDDGNSERGRRRHLARRRFSGAQSGGRAERGAGAVEGARNLKVDGVAGDQTRRELIKEYMGLDGATLLDREIEVTTHGCGELFPLDDSQDDVDAAAEDNKEDQGDRRVELSFFDPDFGIQPPPPGDNSHPGDMQYLAWRKGATLNEQLELGAQTVQVAVVDEAGTPLVNLAFTIVTDTKRTISGTLHAAGKARVPIFRTTPCTFSVQGVDEISLAPASASSDDSVVTADLLANGVTVAPGVPTIITVGLAEALVSTDVNPDDAANLQFTLESTDGAFTQSIAASAGNATDGGMDFLFTGLPTVGKSYTLSFVDDVAKTAIFRSTAFADLAGLGVAQRPDLMEPTAGDPDGQLSTLTDPSDDDPPISTGSANG